MKTKLFWLQGIACNGNTHSFLNYAHLEKFLTDFTFVHHPLFESACSLEEMVESYHDCDILLIEGSISKEFERAGVSIVDIINLYAPHVQKIVTVGTCSTFGGIFKESGYHDSAGLLFCEEARREFAYHDKVVSISGCPIHPDVLAHTLYMLRDAVALRLDSFHRPKEFFGYTVHNGCTRNEYFEYKIDDHAFGKKEGCMFYDHGCQAPYTHGSCNKILWNEVNSKTRAGQPCMGCTEPTFPKQNLFSTKKNMGIPHTLPLGVPKRAYLTLSGVTKAFSIERLEKDLFDE